MARMFYSMIEAKYILGATEEEVKELARIGRLRAFPDGPALFFKVDQVDALAESEGKIVPTVFPWEPIRQNQNTKLYIRDIAIGFVALAFIALLIYVCSHIHLTWS